MSHARLVVAVLSAIVLGAVGLGHALDCEGRLVTMGASPVDVQAICGAPAQVSDTIEIVLKPVYDPQGARRRTPAGRGPEAGVDL
jgi:hypothetical protein